MAIKDYNIITDGQNFFDQPVKNDLRTFDNIPKITTGQGDNYTTGTVWKVSECGVFSGPCFPVFGMNTEIYCKFLYSFQIRKYTDEKNLRIWTLFTQWGCVLDYPYFKEHYKMTAIDLNKQESLVADPKEIQQINFKSRARWPNKNVFYNWRSKKKKKKTNQVFPKEPWKYCNFIVL